MGILKYSLVYKNNFFRMTINSVANNYCEGVKYENPDKSAHHYPYVAVFI